MTTLYPEDVKTFASWLNIPIAELQTVFNQYNKFTLLMAYAISQNASEIIISVDKNNQDYYNFLWKKDHVLKMMTGSQILLTEKDITLRCKKDAHPFAAVINIFDSEDFMYLFRSAATVQNNKLVELNMKSIPNPLQSMIANTNNTNMTLQKFIHSKMLAHKLSHKLPEKTNTHKLKI